MRTNADAESELSPIFIGGHHRSGTTLVRIMLNRHPHIACGPEGQLLDRTSFLDFHRFLEETWIPRLHEYGVDVHEIDVAAAAFINEFFARYAAQRGKRRWAEKTPKNILHIAYLFRLFPAARFIHLIRDPRDIQCSVVAKALATTPRWLDVTAEETARGWVRRTECGVEWRDDPRYLEVRYEDLVQSPEDGMRRMLAFVGEPWHENILHAEPTSEDPDRANVDRPVFNTSVGRWRSDLSPEDVRTIEEIAGPVMRSLGYPPAGEHAQAWRTAG